MAKKMHIFNIQSSTNKNGPEETLFALNDKNTHQEDTPQKTSSEKYTRTFTSKKISLKRIRHLCKASHLFHYPNIFRI